MIPDRLAAWLLIVFAAVAAVEGGVYAWRDDMSAAVADAVLAAVFVFAAVLLGLTRAAAHTDNVSELQFREALEADREAA